MSLDLFSVEEKIEAIETEIRKVAVTAARRERRFYALKSIAADLRARLALTKGAALSELAAMLERIRQHPREDGGRYDDGQMVALANMLISKWSVVRQALEKFEGESE
jgi:hypothetical protein